MKKENKKIKILCTLGPSSLDGKTISKMSNLGVDIFRLNLSHTELDRLEELILLIKKHTAKPICLDTEGAQVRTGYVKDNRIYLEDDSQVVITGTNLIGDNKTICFNPEFVPALLQPGDQIGIDFESVILQIISSDQKSAVARVVSGGYIGSNKAVTIDREIELPVVSKKDQAAIKIGRRHGINHFALSFASCGQDVQAFRRLIGEKSKLIAKIENKRGVEALKEILIYADAILIDRGDLSREEPIEKIPFLQKLIINQANKEKVPVYVATNLLESMVKVTMPTRAEAGDVINTLMDGADGLVLAAETAIGAYPVNCVAMIRKMISQYSQYSHGISLSELQRKESFLLNEPNGGRLVNQLFINQKGNELSKYKSLMVDKNVLLDAEQIAIGTFSPVTGFMNKQEVDSVLRDHRLPSGVIWPLPILLQLTQQEIQGLKIGEKVVLTDQTTGEPYAILTIEDIYNYDLDIICRETFGTLESNHPGVQVIKSKGKYFLGGPIKLIKRLPSKFKQYEITPKQARNIFENKGWSNVVGFHTRNVIHRVHEYIQLLSLENFHCDGLFVHPVVGPKKEGDYKADMILKSYELMLSKYYPKGKVVLAAFQNHSRYAGPREAVFTALCRKNFGCSHFIVGRDHTGVGNYYGPKDSQKLFTSLGDIGITPIFFNELHYCKKCDSYVERCSHDQINVLSVSGTGARQMLKAGDCPPEWFMRKEIASLIIDQIKQGQEVFVR